MALCFSSDGSKNINLSVLTVSVEIFANEQLVAKLELSSLKMKKFLSSAVEGTTAPSQETVKVLKVKMRGRKEGKSSSIFAITDPPLWRETCREHIRQILLVLTAVQTYAASDLRTRKWFFRLFREK